MVADDADAVERRLALGNDLAPCGAIGIERVDDEDAVARRTVVREDVELVLPDVHGEVGVDAADQRLPRRVRLPRVLDEHVGRVPAVLDRDDQPVSVARDLAADEGFRIPRRVVHERIVGGVRAERVESDLGEPGALGDRHGAADRRHPRVVEARAVGRPRCAGVFRSSDDVGQILARLRRRESSSMVSSELFSLIEYAHVACRHGSATSRRGPLVPSVLHGVRIEQDLLDAAARPASSRRSSSPCRRACACRSSVPACASGR